MEVLENVGKSTHRVIVLDISSKKTKSFSLMSMATIDEVLNKLKSAFEQGADGNAGLLER